MSDPSPLPEDLLLSPIEARILGCLVEKEATTPDTYPLTINSLVSACNQKTSRDPLMNLSPGDIGHALRQMAERDLVRQVYGARVERWEHRMDEAYQLTSRRRGLLAVLLLRGPQTLAELLTRVERIAALPGIEHVRDELDRLAEREPPLAVCLGRAPGQREDRYMHLLCGPVDREAFLASQSSDPAAASGSNALAERIAELERRLDELEARLASGQG
jgi:uncharacterized protein YceH (UPF0502 family)